MARLPVSKYLVLAHGRCQRRPFVVKAEIRRTRSRQIRKWPPPRCWTAPHLSWNLPSRHGKLQSRLGFPHLLPSICDKCHVSRIYQASTRSWSRRLCSSRLTSLILVSSCCEAICMPSIYSRLGPYSGLGFVQVAYQVPVEYYHRPSR